MMEHDETLGQDDRIANRLHRAHPDHTRRCCWHVTMSHLENHAIDHDDIPADDMIFDQADGAIGGMFGLCYCDH